MKNLTLYLIVLFCWGCSHPSNETNIAIRFINHNKTIKISGFDKAIVAEIGRDSNNNVWQNLLPIYKMPTDSEMKDFQNIQLGKYNVADGEVSFTPDTPFLKGRFYFLRQYQYDKNKNAWHYITDKSKIGTLRYKDLTFSY